MLSDRDVAVIRRHFEGTQEEGFRVFQSKGYHSILKNGRLWVHNDSGRKQAIQDLYYYSSNSVVGTLTCSHTIKLWDVGRRLSPRETARLMGFPETMILPKSRYNALFGNSVCIPCARFAVSRVVSPNEKLIHLDLCSGIGGFAFSLPCKTALTYFSEISPAAISCYTTNFPLSKPLGDATQIEKWPKCDLVTAGFPCQAFSNTNSRARREVHPCLNFIDVVIHAIRSTGCTRVVLENVAQFKTVGNEQYNRLKRSLKKMGFNSEEEVLDARDFGLPHARRRLYIVARRGSAKPRSMAHEVGQRNAVLSDILGD